MQTLIDMFTEGDRTLVKDSKSFEPLKKVYDSRRSNPCNSEFRFHMKTLSAAIESLEPKNIKIQRGRKAKRIEKLEFNPTISTPNLIVTDKKANSYSVWYMPIIYLPAKNSVKRIIPEFLIMEGERKSIYKKDRKLEKSLYTYEFLYDSLLKDISEEMLEKMNKPDLVIHAKQKFKYKDLDDVKDSQHYLDGDVLVVSEEKLPDEVKMNLPPGVSFSEKVDLNTRKLGDKVKRAFERKR